MICVVAGFGAFVLYILFIIKFFFSIDLNNGYWQIVIALIMPFISFGVGYSIGLMTKKCMECRNKRKKKANVSQPKVGLSKPKG